MILNSGKGRNSNWHWCSFDDRCMRNVVVFLSKNKIKRFKKNIISMKKIKQNYLDKFFEIFAFVDRCISGF